MKHSRSSQIASRSYSPGKIGMMEILVGVAILVVVAVIAFTFMKSGRQKAHMAAATKKMEALGGAFEQYARDNNGLLPLEDAPGKDTWLKAKEAENAAVWYNALPKAMGEAAVGELTDNPRDFYKSSYCLYVPGAPYPKGDKKLKEPLFAIGMSSRLQRKSEDSEVKEQGTVASIMKPASTVIFLERGLPKEKKIWAGQKGFDGSPKANPANFAARHNQKGLLLFADGHVESRKPSEIISKSGLAPFPPDDVVWSRDPGEDPN